MPSLYLYTPLKGHWLFDAGTDFSGYSFDITNLDFYPSEVKRCLCRDDVEPAINALERYNRSVRNFSGYVLDSDPRQLELLHNIVRIVRNRVLKSNRLENVICPELFATPLVIPKPVSKKDYEKRRRFLKIAKEMIFGHTSLETLSRANNASITNIRIWISIYLTHGPAVFFMQPRELEPKIEAIIAYEHFRQRATVHYSCGRHCIMTHNHFKRILHRAQSYHFPDIPPLYPSSIHPRKEAPVPSMRPP